MGISHLPMLWLWMLHPADAQYRLGITMMVATDIIISFIGPRICLWATYFPIVCHSQGGVKQCIPVALKCWCSEGMIRYPEPIIWLRKRNSNEEMSLKITIKFTYLFYVCAMVCIRRSYEKCKQNVLSFLAKLNKTNSIKKKKTVKHPLSRNSNSSRASTC